jgi:hypothetical protein
VDEARLEAVTSGRPPSHPAGSSWDFVHCPPGTGHTFVATGGRPCVLLATGNRRDDLERVYVRSEPALRDDASVPADSPNQPARGAWRVERPGRWDELPWGRDE